MKKQKVVILLYIIICFHIWGSDDLDRSDSIDRFSSVGIGTVIQVTGNVTIDKLGNGDYKQAEIDHYIYLETIIRTGPESSVTIIIEEKSVIVNENSCISGKEIFNELTLSCFTEIKEKTCKAFIIFLRTMFPEEESIPSGIRQSDSELDPYDEVIWMEEEDEYDEYQLHLDEIILEKLNFDEQILESSDMNEPERRNENKSEEGLLSWLTYIVNKDYDKALELLNQMNEISIPEPDFDLIKGFCYFQMEEYLEAVNLFTAGFDQLDNEIIFKSKKCDFYITMFFQKGMAFLYTGNKNQAIKTMEILIENSGDSPLYDYAQELLKLLKL